MKNELIVKQMAELLIDSHQQRRVSLRWFGVSVLFYVIMFAMFVFDRLIAGGVALFGAVVFFFQHRQIQNEYHLTNRRIQHLERENAPAEIKRARLAVERYEILTGMQVADMAVKIEDEAKAES